MSQLYSPSKERYSPVAISTHDKKLRKLKQIIKKNNVDTSLLSFTLSQIIDISMWCKRDIFEYIIRQEKLGKRGGITKDTYDLKTQKEHEWGNYYRQQIVGDNKITTNWTTIVGEYFVKDILTILGHIVILKPPKKESFQPDIITDTSVFEVKTRTYCTSGTAGEKIYGVPWKYSSVPRLYGKPLYIVLVAAQEQRDGAEELFSLLTPEQKNFIHFYDSMNIHFIRMSTLLKKIGL